MRVLISPGASAQPIMSSRARSDPHYVKWRCSIVLLMMSQQTLRPFMRSLPLHFMIQYKQSAVYKWEEEEEEEVCASVLQEAVETGFY